MHVFRASKSKSFVFNKWPVVSQILQVVHLLYVPMGQAEFNN